MSAWKCLAVLLLQSLSTLTAALDVADPSRRLSFGQLLASSIALQQQQQQQQRDSISLTAKGTNSVQQTLFDGFPRAMTYSSLVKRVSRILRQPINLGQSTTLLATSLCCDEVNRELERDFEAVCKYHFVSWSQKDGFAASATSMTHGRRVVLRFIMSSAPQLLLFVVFFAVGSHFNLGGLGGFPFSGVTGFKGTPS